MKLSLPATNPTDTDIAIKPRHDRTSCGSDGVLPRANFDVPAEVLERDVTRPHIRHPAILATVKEIYQAPEAHWDA